MFELPWITIFILYGPLWWLLTILAVIAIIIAIDHDNGFGATITFLGTLILMTCFGTLPLIEWVTNNSWLFTGIILGYFLIGGPIGGITRWYTYVHDELEKYENTKRNWLKHVAEIDTTEVPPEKRIDWLVYASEKFDWIKIKGDRIYDQRERTEKYYPETVKVLQSHPQAWDNKARIITWMTYWPFTLTWLLLNDFITKFFKIIQQKLSNLMDQISRHIFKNVENDFQLPPTTPEKPPQKPKNVG
jgi:hypothetical protein